MIKKIKYSYWIIGIILSIIILSLLPFDEMISTGPKVGIVEINATIMNSKKIVEDLNYFQNKNDIIAIIVRLNTPGGGVGASQEIYDKVSKISKQNKKPIIASMGGLSASGGYYIAIGADTVIANPGTATGSIGVIMSFPVIENLMNKIGVEYEIIKSAQLKDSGSPFRGMTEKEKNYLQNLIDDLHLQFVEVVAKERNMTYEKARKLASGQIFSGRQAYNNGLVDLLGNFEDAILIATKKAGFSKKPKIVYPPKEKKGLLDLLIGNIFTSSTFDDLSMNPRFEYKLPY